MYEIKIGKYTYQVEKLFSPAPIVESSEAAPIAKRGKFEGVINGKLTAAQIDDLEDVISSDKSFTFRTCSREITAKIEDQAAPESQAKYGHDFMIREISSIDIPFTE